MDSWFGFHNQWKGKESCSPIATGKPFTSVQLSRATWKPQKLQHVWYQATQGTLASYSQWYIHNREHLLQMCTPPGDKSTNVTPEIAPNSGPLEFISMNILGQLPKTKNGNPIVVIMTDNHSNFTRTMPTSNLGRSISCSSPVTLWSRHVEYPATYWQTVADNSWKSSLLHMEVFLCEARQNYCTIPWN